MATGGAWNEATTTGWRAPDTLDPSGRTLFEHARASAERCRRLPSPGSTVGGSPWNR